MSVLADGLRLAVGTLTVVPVSRPRVVDRRVGAVAMVLAPLGVLPLAAAAAGTLWLAGLAGAPPSAAAILAVGALALGSRGLHLDGLADTVDGLACTGDRERALAVMRRGDVGPAGAAALVLTLLLQVASLADLSAHDPRHGAVALAAAVLAGRLGLVVACVRGVPAARPDGLGAAVAGSVPPAAAGMVLLVACGAGTAALGWVGLPAVLAAVLAAGLVVRWCRRRLGGVTGDVLGAVVEVATGACLLTLACLAG